MRRVALLGARLLYNDPAGEGSSAPAWQLSRPSLLTCQRGLGDERSGVDSGEKPAHTLPIRLSYNRVAAARAAVGSRGRASGRHTIHPPSRWPSQYLADASGGRVAQRGAAKKKKKSFMAAPPRRWRATTRAGAKTGSRRGGRGRPAAGRRLLARPPAATSVPTWRGRATAPPRRPRDCRGRGRRPSGRPAAASAGECWAREGVGRGRWQWRRERRLGGGRPHRVRTRPRRTPCDRRQTLHAAVAPAPAERGRCTRRGGGAASRSASPAAAKIASNQLARLVTIPCYSSYGGPDTCSSPPPKI